MARVAGRALLEELLDKRVALTTLAAADERYADVLQTAAVRGDNELLRWGVGPDLARGDIVALYTPASRYLPPSERSTIRRLYSVAAAADEAANWNHAVFLYRRVTLDEALSFKALNSEIGLTGREISRLGRLRQPLSQARATRFWELVFRHNRRLMPRIQDRLAAPSAPDDLAISYAGEDWEYAYRLKLWCDDLRLRSFFVTSAGRLGPGTAGPLRELLRRVFSRTRAAVFVVPRPAVRSEWTDLELSSAIGDPEKVVMVRIAGRRSADIDVPEGVSWVDLAPAGEASVIREVKRILRRRRF